MLAESRLLEEAEKIDDSEEITNEEEIELRKKREKEKGRKENCARKKPFIKGCASSETDGEAPGAMRGIEMKRNAKKTEGPLICQMEKIQRAGDYVICTTDSPSVSV
jgi:hypothetical protein